MKNNNTYMLSSFLKITVIVLMVVTVGLLIVLPSVVQRYLMVMGTKATFPRMVLLITLYPCGVLALFIENELRRMLITLKTGNPFVLQNVQSLRRIAVFLLVMFACFIYKILALNTLMTMVVAAVLLLVAFFCFTMADVFNQAVQYKEENDLTI